MIYPYYQRLSNIVISQLFRDNETLFVINESKSTIIEISKFDVLEAYGMGCNECFKIRYKVTLNGDTGIAVGYCYRSLDRAKMELLDFKRRQIKELSLQYKHIKNIKETV